MANFKEKHYFKSTSSTLNKNYEITKEVIVNTNEEEGTPNKTNELMVRDYIKYSM